MQRAVTAIYQSHSIAELVKDELEGIGIGRGHVTIVPDIATPESATPRGEDDPVFDRLHDLHLPDDDSRTYQQAVRNGDYVVSVDVDEEAHLSRVQDIMRRPEDARNLDELDRDYASSSLSARREPTSDTYDERHIGRRDQAQESPYVRSYSREESLGPRNPN